MTKKQIETAIAQQHVRTQEIEVEEAMLRAKIASLHVEKEKIGLQERKLSVAYYGAKK